VRAAAPHRAAVPGHVVLRLQQAQQAIGNHAVGRLLRAVVPGAPLTVGRTGDRYEREADRIADAALSERPLVGEPPGARGAPPPLSAAGAGRDGLPEGFRAQLQPHFAYDLRDVRVHTGPGAAAAAAGIGARAFSVGRDVVFGQGQFEPVTPEGAHLVAHELAHLQQRRPEVRRQAEGAATPVPTALPAIAVAGPEEGEREGEAGPEPASEPSGYEKIIAFFRDYLAPVGEVAVSLIPVVGDVFDAVSAVIGRSLLTWQKLDIFDRLLSLAGIIPIPLVSGGLLRGAKRILQRFLGEPRAVRWLRDAMKTVRSWIVIAWRWVRRNAARILAPVVKRFPAVLRRALQRFATWWRTKIGIFPLVWPATIPVPPAYAHIPNLADTGVAGGLRQLLARVRSGFLLTRRNRPRSGAQQRFRTRYNLQPYEEAHHVIPLFLNGPDDEPNLARLDVATHTLGTDLLQYRQWHMPLFGMSSPSVTKHPQGTRYVVATRVHPLEFAAEKLVELATQPAIELMVTGEPEAEEE
jgi:hypothetical protein